MKWTEMLKEIKENKEFLDGRSDLAGIGDESQVFKSYLATKQEVSENNTLIATISTKAKDAYGDIVEPEGGDFKRWRKNPVVMWAHDYKIPPIGRGLWIKADMKLIMSKCEFAPTEFAQELYVLGQPSDNGHPWIKGWSIGFLPKETEWIKESKEEGDDKQIKGIRFLTWELLEYSFCPIPANPQALTDAIVKGVLKVQNKDLLKQLRNSVTVVDLGAGISSAVDPDSTGKKENIDPESISTSDPPVGQKTQTFKYCVCEKCGYWENKKAGDPCQKHKCPDCGAKLMGSNDKPKKEIEGEDKAKEQEALQEFLESLRARIDGTEKAIKLMENENKQDTEDYKKAQVKLDKDKKELAMLLDCIEKGKCKIQVTDAGVPEKKKEEEEGNRYRAKNKAELTIPVKIDGMEIVEKFKERLEKAGAVLNKANKDKLAKASTLIQEVLSSAEASDEGKSENKPEPKKDILNGIEVEPKQTPVETKPEAIVEGVSLEDVQELLDTQGKTLHGIVRQTVRKMLGKVD